MCRFEWKYFNVCKHLSAAGAGASRFICPVEFRRVTFNSHASWTPSQYQAKHTQCSEPTTNIYTLFDGLCPSCMSRPPGQVQFGAQFRDLVPMDAGGEPGNPQRIVYLPPELDDDGSWECDFCRGDCFYQEPVSHGGGDEEVRNPDSSSDRDDSRSDGNDERPESCVDSPAQNDVESGGVHSEGEDDEEDGGVKLEYDDEEENAAVKLEYDDEELEEAVAVLEILVLARLMSRFDEEG